MYLAKGSSTMVGLMGLIKGVLFEEREPSSINSTSPSIRWSKWELIVSNFGWEWTVPSWERFPGDGGKEFSSSSGGITCILHEHRGPWWASMINGTIS